MKLASKLHSISIALVLGALAAAIAPAAYAQIVGGSISGTVREATGASLEGASVSVVQIETGATRKLVTGSDGRFFAPSVPVGRYSVSVAHEGFARQERSGITLTVGQSLQVDFVLGVEAVQQQVEVDAAGETVNITTQQTAGLIDERQVKELPLERPQLRRTADAESRHGELHGRTLGQHRNLEFIGRQHVFG